MRVRGVLVDEALPGSGIPDHDQDVLEAEYGRQTGGMWNLYRFKRGFRGTVHRHLGTFDRVIPAR